VVIILSRNPIPLWLNFLRNCLDVSVLFVIFSSDNYLYRQKIDVDSALDVTSVKFEPEVLSDVCGVQFSNLEDETFFIGNNYVFK
jgi:hypothetical protein